jgi:hypothetical protein
MISGRHHSLAGTGRMLPCGCGAAPSWDRRAPARLFRPSDRLRDIRSPPRRMQMIPQRHLHQHIIDRLFQPHRRPLHVPVPCHTCPPSDTHPGSHKTDTFPTIYGTDVRASTLAEQIMSTCAIIVLITNAFLVQFQSCCPLAHAATISNAATHQRATHAIPPAVRRWPYDTLGHRPHSARCPRPRPGPPRGAR